MNNSTLDSVLDAPTRTERRHDLDALRAATMLLGILLHSLMSFIPAGWIVQDAQAGGWASVFVQAIHGFRMPLFFLLSGFFTAMLWRERGLKSLISNRVRRILLPLSIGLFTIVPAVWVVSSIASRRVTTQQTAGIKADRVGAQSIAVTEDETAAGIQMLEAAMRGNDDEVARLLASGVDVNFSDDRGSTSLLVASLFGHSAVAKRLVEAGADPSMMNADNTRAADTLKAPWGLTKFWADLLKVEIERSQVAEGRLVIADLLGEKLELHSSMTAAEGSLELSGIGWLLFYFPVFHHLWFLWFLCWLVLAFVICVSVGNYCNIRPPATWLTASNWKFAWIIPMTAIVQLPMTGFGPDTSAGLLPMPSVLLYYAIFFGFGALYFDSHRTEVHRPHQWWMLLVVAFALVFPLAMQLQTISDLPARLAFVTCAATFAWLMSFGLLEAFRKYLSQPSASIRYVADSSYWLYLAHIPLVIYLQYFVKDWTATAWVKVPLLCLVTFGILIVTYQWFVRYTAIGTLLNGRRTRPGALKSAL